MAASSNSDQNRVRRQLLEFMQMSRVLGLALTAAALASAPLQAQTRVEQAAADLAAARSWHFAASESGPDGRPVCVESWTFRADGTTSIISGAQQIEGTWRVTSDADDTLWLMRKDLSSTSGPDCMGAIADPAVYPREETGIALLFFKDGTALTCSQPDRLQNPDGQWVVVWGAEMCWGSIRPGIPGTDQP